MPKEMYYSARVSGEPFSNKVVLTTHSFRSDVSIQTVPIPTTYETNRSVESTPVVGKPDFYAVTETRVTEEVQVYPFVGTAINRKRLALAAKRTTSYVSLPVTATAIAASLAEVIPSLSEKQFAWEWAAAGLAGLSVIVADKFLPDTAKTREQLQKLKSYRGRSRRRQVDIPAQRKPIHDVLPVRVNPAQA